MFVVFFVASNLLRAKKNSRLQQCFLRSNLELMSSDYLVCKPSSYNHEKKIHATYSSSTADRYVCTQTAVRPHRALLFRQTTSYKSHRDRFDHECHGQHIVLLRCAHPVGHAVLQYVVMPAHSAINRTQPNNLLGCFLAREPLVLRNLCCFLRTSTEGVLVDLLYFFFVPRFICAARDMTTKTRDNARPCSKKKKKN